MNSFLPLLQNVFYPFWYFLVLAIFLEVSKYTTLFFVAGGRLKSFHSIKNYWIYLSVTLLCGLIGLVVGHSDLVSFLRWFICPLSAAFMGIHVGYDKALALSRRELTELEDEIDELE